VPVFGSITVFRAASSVDSVSVMVCERGRWKGSVSV
jgi:hypothetical protein